MKVIPISIGAYSDSKPETPELIWEQVKIKAFKGQCPDRINNLMHKAFEESEDESEKWEKLAFVMNLIKQKPIPN